MNRQSTHTNARALPGAGAFVCVIAAMSLAANGSRSPGEGDAASP